jgi:hypothetical protein
LGNFCREGIDEVRDIWNLSALSMLGAMMAPRGFFDPATGRMQIR